MISGDLLTIIRIIIAVFAVVSLTDILVYQKIAQPIRKAAGIWHGEDGTRTSHDDSFFASMLWCFRCTSVWVSAFFVLVWFIYPPAFDALGLFFALSYVATRAFEKF